MLGGVACPPEEEEAHWRSSGRQQSTRLAAVGFRQYLIVDSC